MRTLATFAGSYGVAYFGLMWISNREHDIQPEEMVIYQSGSAGLAFLIALAVTIGLAVSRSRA